MKNLIYFLPLLALLGGCGVKESPAYQKDFEALVSWPSIADSQLIDLDQKYSNNWELKTSIGVFYLTKGNLEKAGVFLGKALELKSWPADQEKEYLLYSALADWNYRKANIDDALIHVDRALKLSAEDKLSNRLLKARLLFVKGQKDEAEKLFQEVWAKEKSQYSRADFQAYFSIASEKKNWELSRSILDQEILTVGYESGMGLKYSVVFENLQKIPESIFCAFFDLRTATLYGGLSASDSTMRINALKDQLTKSFPKEKWQVAFNAVSEFDKSNPVRHSLLDELANSCVLVAYLNGAEKIKLGKIDGQTNGEWLKLEKSFVNLSEYYYLLSKALKAGSGYNYQNVNKVLERTILLSPSSTFASYARSELGRLLGLSEADSAKILLPDELTNLAVKYRSTLDVKVFSKVLDLIETENNPYSDFAQAFLREMVSIAEMRKYVTDRSVTAPSKFKIKYQGILN